MAEEKSFLSSKGFWVFTAVVAATIAAVMANIKAGTLNLTTGARLTASAMTGIWYSVRFYYTSDIAKKQNRFIALLFTFVIAVCGLLSLAVVDKDYWFCLLAGTLLLGVEKDYEIIHDLRHHVKGDMDFRSGRGWRARLVSFHHWYSIVRDLSMAFWWMIYGVASWKLGFTHRLAAPLFAVPYVFLVLTWCIVKDKTAAVEEALLKRLK